MPPMRVHYVPTPDFGTLTCGTPFSDFENLQTTQDGSRVNCRRCLRQMGAYRASRATLAAYGAGCVTGYNAGYNDGFGDALEDFEEDDEDE